MTDQALHGPGGRVPQGADGVALDLLGDLFSYFFRFFFVVLRLREVGKRGEKRERKKERLEVS